MNRQRSQPEYQHLNFESFAPRSRKQISPRLLALRISLSSHLSEHQRRLTANTSRKLLILYMYASTPSQNPANRRHDREEFEDYFETYRSVLSRHGDHEKVSASAPSFNRCTLWSVRNVPFRIKYWKEKGKKCLVTTSYQASIWSTKKTECRNRTASSDSTLDDIRHLTPVISFYNTN